MKGEIGDKVKYCHVYINGNKSFYFDHVHIVWDQQITLHQHDEREISYIVTGSGTRVIGDAVETFSSGEVVFLPPNMPHGWYFNDYDHDREGKIENITIIFPESMFDGFVSSFPETRQSIAAIRQVRDGIRFEGETLRRVRELMTEMMAKNDIGRLSSFLELISVIGSSSETRMIGSRYRKDKVAVKMQEVSRFMMNNFQREVSLEEVARYVGMNRSSFCSFFKREQGKTFFSALNEYRIDCSCLMLRQTELSVADVGFAVGFNDIPHYNRTFKRLKGISPKYYRAKCQESKPVALTPPIQLCASNGEISAATKSEVNL
jgi:AraC-like DNA-binding protein